MKVFNIQDVPEFIDFYHQTDIRDTLLLAASDKKDAINNIANVLEIYVLCPYQIYDNFDQKTLIGQLIKKGYSKKQISYALSISWVNNTTTFSLPEINFIEYWGKPLIVFISIILLIIFSLILFFLIMYREHPSLLSALIAFPPLIALPGFSIAWLVYAIIINLWKDKEQTK